MIVFCSNCFKRSKLIFSLALGNFQVANLSSIDIRNRFLDYFIKDNNHVYVPSSPVIPLHDKSLAFVNAGMNQFKDIFLNRTQPTFSKAANSQKCIRIGGKHNDLKDIGFDTYHHTFFEMLGNWSFGNYFKREACKLAWDLLTTPPYSIDPKRLYVTYFKGSHLLELPPDIETKEIWQSIGVQSDHILGFGAKENFWEMGRTGPCGPCSEIHVDLEGNRDAATRVNQGFPGVPELWNLVFIQFNRNEDGTLSKLPQHHVDTGMGLERLVALLQNKKSNYDTDLFSPLFDAISKVSKAPTYGGRFGGEDSKLDTAYRVVADHSRMTAVAIADGMYPDVNQKLRRVIRKALLAGEEIFKIENPVVLMNEACNCVAEILSPTYPEIDKNLGKIQLVVAHEWEVLRSSRGSAWATWHAVVGRDARLSSLVGCDAPGLPAAYRELAALPPPRLPPDAVFRLYDTHGLSPDLIEDLCHALGLDFREDELNVKLQEAKERSTQSLGKRPEALTDSCVEELKKTVPTTDDSAKYDYSRHEDTEGRVRYVFPKVESEVLALVMGGGLVGSAQAGERVGLVLGRTCLYCEAGGQQADFGRVEGEGWFLDCDALVNCGGFVVHFGILTSSDRCATSGTAEVRVGSRVLVHVDESRRLANMCNHTATHCLNAELRRLFTTCHQKSSSVNDQRLVFEFAVAAYGQQVTKSKIIEVERRVQKVVKEGIPVTRSTVSSSQLASMDDVTLLPGETYPSQNIHLIQIMGGDFLSKEACCGTHIRSTQDIEDFCICTVKSLGSNAKSVTALTGEAARQALAKGQNVLADVNLIRQHVVALTAAESTSNEQLEDINGRIKEIKSTLPEMQIPFADQSQVLAHIEEATKLIKDAARKILRRSIEEEMKGVLVQLTGAEGRENYLVHRLLASSQLDDVPLQKVTNMCPAHVPVLVFAYSQGQLKARCVVPKELAFGQRNAEEWIAPVLTVVKGRGGAPRGQDPKLVYNLSAINMSPEKFKSVVDEALAVARLQAIKLFGL